MQVSTKMIKDANVTAAKLATGAVTDVKLAASAKQSVLESKYLKAMVEATNIAGGTGTSINFGTKFAADTGTQKIGGSDSAEGLVVTSILNLCDIRTYNTKKPIEDASGNDVYGRITDASATLTGTTDWTLSSGDVAGSSTIFQTEVAVNDIIVGPDGALYRVTTVTSDTAIVVTPVYAGTTVTGQTSVRHRLTLSFWSMVAGTETAFTMASQQIDVQFPESYDMYSLPFGALTTGVAWSDIIGPADHNHDTRYYTKTELNADTGTVGATLIGYDDAGRTHITASNTVDEAIAELDGAIGTAHAHVWEPKTIVTQDVIPVLANTPLAATAVILTIDGIAQRYGAGLDYTVSGTTITWSYANSGFHIEAGDEVWVSYPY
jgi:hypothetical protein